jgi:hypothetical protein
VRMHDTGGGVASLKQPEPQRSRAMARRETDATVGGGAGG